MSNQSGTNNPATTDTTNPQNLPAIHGTPIPQAPINNDPSHGRTGPIIDLHIPKNLVGKPDYSRKPGLDLSAFIPESVGNPSSSSSSSSSSNTNTGSGGGTGEGEAEKPATKTGTLKDIRLPPRTGFEAEPSTSGTYQKDYQKRAPPPMFRSRRSKNTTNDNDSTNDSTNDSSTDTISFGRNIYNRIMSGLQELGFTGGSGSGEDGDTFRSEADVLEVTDILAKKLPVELIENILDEAEYFAHDVLAERQGRLWVTDGDKVYLTAVIPDFTALEADTAGKGGREGAGGRRGRVRRLVFKVRSKDQGWSSYSEHYGSYRGCWSWLDVEVWRGGDAVDPVSDEHHNEEAQEEIDEDYQGSSGGEGEPAEVNNAGKHKLGDWLLQRNKHAFSDHIDHEIVWDWREDGLPDDDDDKWEPDSINAEGNREQWDKDGRRANGELVRELRGGDEIRVIIKARYGGWRCEIESCKVECFWAV
ncbi:hypothetical protein H072_2060 [Dactylellina haptotyla CBS 200.50]|uniref:Uncharacterized protein n=1 Tax=Dactylellina haptotyla (strain CBS 200.50) TaxID=1284197 RepID=S8ASA9_DACHA|nr:hypothetical protein H072_2060 [Dactylellina haptotyla CBS 200.50]